MASTRCPASESSVSSFISWIAAGIFDAGFVYSRIDAGVDVAMVCWYLITRPTNRNLSPQAFRSGLLAQTSSERNTPHAIGLDMAKSLLIRENNSTPPVCVPSTIQIPPANNRFPVDGRQ